MGVHAYIDPEDSQCQVGNLILRLLPGIVGTGAELHT